MLTVLSEVCSTLRAAVVALWDSPVTVTPVSVLILWPAVKELAPKIAAVPAILDGGMAPMSRVTFGPVNPVDNAVPVAVKGEVTSISVIAAGFCVGALGVGPLTWPCR